MALMEMDFIRRTFVNKLMWRPWDFFVTISHSLQIADAFRITGCWFRVSRTPATLRNISHTKLYVNQQDSQLLRFLSLRPC